MPQSFTSTPIDDTVAWDVSEEDESSLRWVTTIRAQPVDLDVNVIVPLDSLRRPYLLKADRAIRNVVDNFEHNLEYILRWYKSRYPDSNAARFREDLMKSVTLFIDFTESPVKRELLFWETDLQHLGVPLTSRGRIVPVKDVPR